MDVQIVKYKGLYYLMGVEYKTREQIDSDTLLIYVSNQLLTNFQYKQTIRTNRCEERGAVLIFKMQDMIIRPTQCCEIMSMAQL